MVRFRFIGLMAGAKNADPRPSHITTRCVWCAAFTVDIESTHRMLHTNQAAVAPLRTNLAHLALGRSQNRTCP